MTHASGWHCINGILRRLSRKGTINTIKNRYSVASLLAKIKLSEKKSNEDVYQAPPGLLQIANTGQKFPEIHKQTKTQAVIGKFNIPFVFFVADV